MGQASSEVMKSQFVCFGAARCFLLSLSNVLTYNGTQYFIIKVNHRDMLQIRFYLHLLFLSLLVSVLCLRVVFYV